MADRGTTPPTPHSQPLASLHHISNAREVTLSPPHPRSTVRSQPNTLSTLPLDRFVSSVLASSKLYAVRFASFGRELRPDRSLPAPKLSTPVVPNGARPIRACEDECAVVVVVAVTHTLRNCGQGKGIYVTTKRHGRLTQPNRKT